MTRSADLDAMIFELVIEQDHLSRADAEALLETCRSSSPPLSFLHELARVADLDPATVGRLRAEARHRAAPPPKRLPARSASSREIA